MIREFGTLLRRMEESVVPVGKEGLESLVENTVHIKLLREGPVEIQWVKNGQLRTDVGPVAATNSSNDELAMRTNSWLSSVLPKHLNKFVEKAKKDFLPSCMSAITTLAGIDIEDFLVSGETRGPCTICPSNACKQVKTYMIHMRVGLGVVMITFEGMTVEELVKIPSQNIPRMTKCIAPTACEVSRNIHTIEAVKVISRMLFSEAHSDIIGAAFNANKKDNERGEINTLLETLGLPKVGTRIIESSAFEKESVAGSVFKPYESRKPSDPVWSRLNAQTVWLTSKSVPGDGWMNPESQSGFRLDLVKTRSTNLTEEPHRYREETVVFVYNATDNVIPLYLTYAGFAKYIASHPLLLLMGQSRFVEELLSILLEVLARGSTEEKGYHRAENAKLPDTVEEVFSIVDSLHKLTYKERMARYRAGAYSLLGVDGAEFPSNTGLWFGAPITTRRTGPVSEPQIVVSSKKKKSEFRPLQDHEAYVEVARGGKIRMDKHMAASSANFEIVEGGRASFINPHVRRGEVDTTVKRARDESREEKTRKKPRDDEPKPASKFVWNEKDVESWKKKFPRLKSTIEAAVKSSSIDSKLLAQLMVEVRDKLSEVVADRHIGRVAYNSDDNDDVKKLNSEKSIIEKRLNDRAKQIKELQQLQSIDRDSLKDVNAKLEVHNATEENRRMKEKLNRMTDKGTAVSNAFDAASEFVSAAKQRMVGDPDKVPAVFTVKNTLKRQNGIASTKLPPPELTNWTRLTKCDKLRNEAAMTSGIAMKIVGTERFQKAIAKFNEGKKHTGTGDLSKIGQNLSELKKLDEVGAASWKGCQRVMLFLDKMKMLSIRRCTKEVKKLWSAEEIVESKDGASKKVENYDIKARILVDMLVEEFEKAVLEITGEHFSDISIWYFDKKFQRDYKDTFDEGVDILRSWSLSDSEARVKMEAIITQRQQAPLTEAEAARIDNVFQQVNSGVIVDEEIVEEDMVVDDEHATNERRAPHLMNYD